MNGESKSELKRRGQYWICDSCAAKRNWTHWKRGNTCILDVCGWCDNPNEQMLTPVVDLKKPEPAKETPE